MLINNLFFDHHHIQLKILKKHFQIVWDPVLNKWTNREEDQDGTGPASLPPPPKAADIPGFRPQHMPNMPSPSSLPPIMPTSNPGDSASLNTSKPLTGGGNMYKMPKAKNMRANYIDIMNPGGPKSPMQIPNVSSPGNSPAALPMAASSPRLFIPTPGMLILKTFFIHVFNTTCRFSRSRKVTRILDANFGSANKRE